MRLSKRDTLMIIVNIYVIMKSKFNHFFILSRSETSPF